MHVMIKQLDDVTGREGANLGPRDVLILWDIMGNVVLFYNTVRK